MRNGLIIIAILGLCLLAVTTLEDEADVRLPAEAGGGHQIDQRDQSLALEPVAMPITPAPVATEVPPTGGSLKLPDGTYLPTLNGVSADLELTWPSHLPFSPVVGRVVDSQGIERYLHADGSQSTTQMVYRSDLGRADAAVLVSTPRPAAPLKQASGSSRRR